MAEVAARLALYTVGHSTRTIEEFVGILQSASIRRVVDVRSIPRSRTNPQYNLDTLPGTLSSFQINHSIIPELGGRRSRQRDVPPEINQFWNNQSFHNYADYAMSEEFRAGLQLLMALGRSERCAIMCSEAVWWRCHRRIITDYLLFEGWEVSHLMGHEKIVSAHPTTAAVANGTSVTYPA